VLAEIACHTPASTTNTDSIVCDRDSMPQREGAGKGRNGGHEQGQ